MPYDPIMVQPMREELVHAGVQEMRTAADVDAIMANKTGTTMIVVNSVCGCAAGQARPGVRLALQHGSKPDRVVTVFAGQDVDATAQARSYFSQFPPSSPSIALFKDGEVVHFVPRHAIEGRDALTLANNLAAAFDKYCAGARA